MRKKLIGLICVLTSLESFANFPSLDNVLYQPFKTNSDIYFELESKELTSLINTKLLLNLNENTNWKIFKLVAISNFHIFIRKLNPFIREGPARAYVDFPIE